MPLFYKQGDSPGVWKNVETPFMKQQGDWVEPEQVYIKEDGSWKLIFEKFTFVVETLGFTETSQETVLEGRLIDFENDFEAEDSFFFDQKLEQPGYVNATAVDEDRKLIAVGGGDGQVYVFDSQLRINRVSSAPTPSRIDNLDTITQPAGEIEGLDFYRSEDVLAVAADNLYVYDENFSDINVFSTDEGNGYTDVEFNESTGQIAASTPGGYVYIYQFDDPGWSQTQKVNFTGDGLSVSWRESDSYFAVGTSAGTVEVYDGSFNSTNTLSNHTGNVKVEFNGSGTLATVDENEVKVYSGDPLTLDETFLDSTEGPEGDVDWSGDGFLVHASTDKRIYVYDSNATYELVKSFNNASRTFKSVSWDGENHQIVAGTAQNGSGEAFVYSTGARMFFDWGEFGSDYEYRQRASGLRATGDPGGNFQIGLDGLDVNTQYEFRAGGFAAGGRVVIDVERDGNNNIINKDTFTTADISVVTQGPTDTTSSSTTFVGTVDTFNKSGNIDVSFEWGEEGNGLPNELDAGLVSGNVQFQKNVDGLASSQTYEYRAKAKFGGVTVRGSINTVTIGKVTANMVSSDPVDFGTAFETSTQDQGSTSSRNITIEESGGSGDGYNIENVSITGPDDNEFTVVSVPSSSTSPDVPSGTQKNIDVRFEAINDGSRTATIEIEHDAPLGNDPLQVGLEGVAEKAVNLEVPGTTFTTTADQNEETKTFNINETGGDYDATITSIEEANSQPANHESSEWRIVNRPGNLDSGGDATVPAGGTVSFEVGWNPDTGDAQDYDIVINYQGQGVPDSETEEITINGTVSGIVNIAVDPERDGNTSRGVTDGSFTYTFDDTLERDRSGTNVQTVVPFSIVGDKDGEYEVTNIQFNNNGDNDFSLANVPTNDVTDGNSSTGRVVNITNPGDLRFDVVFDPTATGNRTAEFEVSANGANNNTHTINLEGTGLQPSEINTSTGSLDLGNAIFGGNVSGEEATASVSVTNASSDIDYQIFSDATNSEDFEITSSIEGNTVTGSDTYTADLEFVPKAENGYSDDTTVSASYEITHDAQLGNRPKQVALEGTVQITDLTYTDPSSSTFDPTTGTIDFSITATPDSSTSKTFTIENDAANSKSTNISLLDSDSASTVSLDTEKTQNISPGSTIQGTVTFSPNTVEDSGDQGDVDVIWDNETQSSTIVIEGLVDSTIDVRTPDADGFGVNDGTLDFGGVTAGETKTLTVTVREAVGINDFNITSASNLGTYYTVTNNFDGNSGSFNTTNVVVSNGSPVTADIEFDPSIGQADNVDNTVTDTFSFDHDAAYAPESYEENQVSINLTGKALDPAGVKMEQDSDSSQPISYSANYESVGGTYDTTDNTTILISETGGDNEVRLYDSGDTFSISNDPNNNFSLNSGYSSYDNTIAAGKSVPESVVEFAPDQSTGSNPDYIVTADLTVNFEGAGVDNSTASTTVQLEGEVIRPAKADSQSSTIQFTGSEDGGEYPYDAFSNGEIPDYENYVMEEVNDKNSYEITNIETLEGDGTTSFAYENDVSDYESIIPADLAVNGTGTIIPEGGSKTGTVEFSPGSEGGIYNHTIEIYHDGPAGDNPVVINLEATIVSDVNQTSDTISATDLASSDNGDGTYTLSGSFTLDGVEEALEQLTLTVTPDEIAGSITRSPDINETDSNIASTTDTNNSNTEKFELINTATGDITISYDFEADNVSQDFQVEINGAESGFQYGNLKTVQVN